MTIELDKDEYRNKTASNIREILDVALTSYLNNGKKDMKQYEYLILDNRDFSSSSLSNRFNQLGLDGWKLITVVGGFSYFIKHSEKDNGRGAELSC